MKNITILDMEIAAGQLYVVFFSCFNFHSFQPITMNEIVLTNVLINQSSNDKSCIQKIDF